jgi:hypoxanthine phosphoribosyltransferase
MLNSNPENLLQNSSLVYSSNQVDEAINRISKQIGDDLNNAFPIVLAVMGGAIYFTGQLLGKLNIALQFDYLQATRYSNTTNGSDLVWRVEPPTSVKGRVVLILDDILDEGITLAEIKSRCLQMGATDVLIAVLFEKDLMKHKLVKADYVGLVVPNQYVFGCGMDVYGWWRNLPEVRALKI